MLQKTPETFASALTENSRQTLTLATMCIATFVAILGTKRRVQDPLVDLAPFRSRAFSAAIGDAALMTFGMYGTCCRISTICA
jgi:hypothetical protein